MLVISRKKDQTIHIGDGIIIKICQIKGSGVRIGISAPPATHVLRGELVWDLEDPVDGFVLQSQDQDTSAAAQEMVA